MHKTTCLLVTLLAVALSESFLFRSQEPVRALHPGPGSPANGSLPVGVLPGPALRYPFEDIINRFLASIMNALNYLNNIFG